jgi:hypothetical protein
MEPEGFEEKLQFSLLKSLLRLLTDLIVGAYSFMHSSWSLRLSDRLRLSAVMYLRFKTFTGLPVSAETHSMFLGRNVLRLESIEQGLVIL